VEEVANQHIMRYNNLMADDFENTGEQSFDKDENSFGADNVTSIIEQLRNADFSALGNDPDKRKESGRDAIRMPNTDLSNIDCSGIDFYDGGRGPNFSRCTCNNTDFSDCNLFWANFFRADLRGADFSRAQMCWANIDGAKIDETTKGLEAFARASANSLEIDAIANRCGAEIPDLLLHFGGPPTMEQIEPFLISPDYQDEYFKLNHDIYDKQFHRFERNGSIVYFGDSRKKQFSDEYAHHERGLIYDGCYKPGIDLNTPPEELLNPMKFNYFWLQSEQEREDMIGCRLEESNTRHLSEIGRAALDIYEEEEEEEVNYLELGAGAGVSAAEANDRENVTVDTVSLTPTVPTIRLNYTWEEIYHAAEKAFDHENHDWDHWENILRLRGTDEIVLAGVRRIYYCTQNGSESIIEEKFPLKTRVVFALHTLFPQLQIFTREKPFIRKQYICKYPFETEIPGKKYQILHDDNGPLWHITNWIATRKEKPQENTIMNLIYSCYHQLDGNGCIVCKRIDVNAANTSSLEEANDVLNMYEGRDRDGKLKSLEYYAKQAARPYGTHDVPETFQFNFVQKGDLFLLGGGDNKHQPFVFAKKESPVAKKMKEKLGLSEDDGGFYRVDNLLDQLAA